MAVMFCEKCGHNVKLPHYECSSDNYKTETVSDVIRAIKQKPADLKVLTHSDGLYYIINEIRTCYVIPARDWGNGKCFQEVDECTKGAIQIVLID